MASHLANSKTARIVMIVGKVIAYEETAEETARPVLYTAYALREEVQ